MPSKDSIPPGRGRLQLVLLFLVFLLPVLAGLWIFRSAEEDGAGATTARGTLIQPPRPLPAVDMRQASGEPLPPNTFTGRWTLLYLDGTSCSDFCEQQLDNIIQTRLALGKDMLRVQCMLLFDPDSRRGRISAIATRLKGSYIGATAERDIFNTLIETFRLQPSENVLTSQRTYIIDPLGNLMMYYPPHGDPKDMLRDLLRLLKVSRVG